MRTAREMKIKMKVMTTLFRLRYPISEYIMHRTTLEVNNSDSKQNTATTRIARSKTHRDMEKKVLKVRIRVQLNWISWDVLIRCPLGADVES